MLEIIFLVWFCRKLAAIAKEKNRSGGWGALGALLWIAGEIGGLLVNIDALDRGSIGDVYPLMIVGALLGGALAWIIVANLKPIPRDGELPVARIV